jgi:uncharacterized membrane protein YgdD (TMEM256/DUF423 family)
LADSIDIMYGRWAIIGGALLAATAVALGAYAAHGLEDQIVFLGFETDLAGRLDWFETGAEYHMVHALALILTGLVAERRQPSKVLGLAGALFVLGILLFSGSLYAMTLLAANWKWLGAITPFGGLSFILGWVLLAIGSRAQ